MTTPAGALATGRMAAGLMPGVESPAHFRLSASTRQGKIAQIRRYLARWGARADPVWGQRLERIRLSRGRSARKARRARIHGIGKTVYMLRGTRPSWDRPSRGRGERLPRADRLLLLRQDGRPVSGRQWRQFRKAARRQERAS